MCVFEVGGGRGFISLHRGQPVHIWNACEIFTGAPNTGNCEDRFKIEASRSENDHNLLQLQICCCASI